MDFKRFSDAENKYCKFGFLNRLKLTKSPKVVIFFLKKTCLKQINFDFAIKGKNQIKILFKNSWIKLNVFLLLRKLLFNC